MTISRFWLALIDYTVITGLLFYASQWPLFYRTMEAWRAALECYGRSCGARGVVERSWTISAA